MLSRFARLRLRFQPRHESLVLAILGLAVGACAGAVSIAFRTAIEACQRAVAPLGDFTALSYAERFAMPLAGVVLAIVVLYAAGRAAPGIVATGVVHVLDRLDRGAPLPLRNALVQFVAGALLLGFGVSMGREGPAIHLGAASASLIGERLRVSRVAARTLIGCGVAGAVGAAFNTPLAGVVLSIEVVLIEYTAGGFTPILLAAVSGAALGRVVYGDAPAFMVPAMTFGSLLELPWIAAMGLAIGAYAATFVACSRGILRLCTGAPWWARMLAGGVLVGGVAVAVPQVMGVGYDVVGQVLRSHYALGALAAISAAKLLATAIGVGARMPAGLIGPTLVMGAVIGAIFGLLGAVLVPSGASNAAFYVMLGMGAMMGATLQAPLSALVGVLELTGNPQVVLPGLLAIVVASLVFKHVFRCESIFAMQMRETEITRTA